MCRSSNTPASLVNWESVTGNPFLDWQCDVCGQIRKDLDLPIAVDDEGNQECIPTEFPLADALQYDTWYRTIAPKRAQKIDWKSMTVEERKEFLGS